MAADQLGMVGRWIGHMRDGQFTHISIGSSPPIVHESILGWVFHYVVGCIYAALYLMYVSTAQMGQPTLVSAVLFGLVTILSPWLLMQPALGLGICASKAPRSNLVRLQNLINPYYFWISALLFLSSIKCVGIVVFTQDHESRTACVPPNKSLERTRDR